MEVSASIECVMLLKNQQIDMRLALNLQFRILMEVKLCEEEFRCRADSLHCSQKLYAPIIDRAAKANQWKCWISDCAKNADKESEDGSFGRMEQLTSSASSCEIDDHQTANLQDLQQPFIEVKMKHCFCSDISKSNPIRRNKNNAISGPNAATNRSIQRLSGRSARSQPLGSCP